jgi:O-antigen/teichoic acid export membrane protein
VSVRVIAAVSSIFFVRALSVENYALFTVLLTAFTFACTFSDLGATESLAYFRRRALKRNRAWHGYIRAVRRLRRLMLLFSLIVAVVYILWVTRVFDHSIVTVGLAILAVVVGASFASSASIWMYLLRLENSFSATYVAEICNEITKLLIASLMLYLGLKNALIAFLGIVFGSAVFFGILSSRCRVSWSAASLTGPSNASVDSKRLRALLAQARHVFPVAIYFALQGPLLVWMAAEFGGVQTVGQFGALGRVSAVLAAVTGFLVAVVAPRLSSVTDDIRFRTGYARVVFLLCAYAFMLAILVWLFVDYILLLLGADYLALRTELYLSVACGVASTFVVFFWQVSRIRGWLRWQTLRIPVLFAAQVTLVFALDLSSLRGILWLSLGTFLVDATLQLAINLDGFRRRGRDAANVRA